MIGRGRPVTFGELNMRWLVYRREELPAFFCSSARCTPVGGRYRRLKVSVAAVGRSRARADSRSLRLRSRMLASSCYFNTYSPKEVTSQPAFILGSRATSMQPAAAQSDGQDHSLAGEPYVPSQPEAASVLRSPAGRPYPLFLRLARPSAHDCISQVPRCTGRCSEGQPRRGCGQAHRRRRPPAGP